MSQYIWDGKELIHLSGFTTGNVDIATRTQPGIVTPVDDTINLDEDGNISIPIAEPNKKGLVTGDGTTIESTNGIVKMVVNQSNTEDMLDTIPVDNEVTDNTYFLGNKGRQHSKKLSTSIWNYIARKIRQSVVISPVELYVSELGDDETGDGSSSKPFRSLMRAVKECPMGYEAQPNDMNIVHVASGAYTEPKGLIVSGKRIIFYLDGDISITGDYIENSNDGGATGLISSVSGAYVRFYPSDGATVNITLSGSLYSLYADCAGFLAFDNINSVSASNFGGANLAVANVGGLVSFTNINRINHDATAAASTVTTIATLSCWNRGLVVCTNTGTTTLAVSYTSAQATRRAINISNGACARISNLTIPKQYTHGLVTATGSVICYSGTITNNSTTKNTTGTGGRILAGTQSSIPNY